LSRIERASHVTASSLGSIKGIQVHAPTNLTRLPRLFRVQRRTVRFVGVEVKSGTDDVALDAM